MRAEDVVAGVRAALNTDEQGMDLIEGVRNAHQAEVDLMRISRVLDDDEDDNGKILGILLILGRNDG